MRLAKGGRQASRGIVLNNGAVMLLERWRTDESGKQLHYFSVPGGKIEPGETPEIAAVREMFEETSLIVRTKRLLAKQYFDSGSTNQYFLCDYLSGDPKLHATAPEHQSKANRSQPRWITKAQLKKIPLKEVHEPIRQLIIDVFAGKLPEKPLQIK